ncbi:hypothetical protein J6590_104970 [Homalodisca vitripennis]|nr:hypothetical protein J6590_104970 [Homalodisca vitripennis]
MASLEVFLQDFGKDFLQEEDGGEKGIVQKDERLFKMLFGTQMRCAHCSTKDKEKRSDMVCPTCNVPLCKDCFTPFHQN